MDAKLESWAQRLRSVPRLALPTDYPRTNNQVVEAVRSIDISVATGRALARLALFEDESEAGAEAVAGAGAGADNTHTAEGPSVSHLILTAFVVLLHRYTGDTDIVIGTTHPDGEVLALRVAIEPGDSFWQVAKRIQQLEAEAVDEAVPFDEIARRVEADRAAREGPSPDGVVSPIFRVRFVDATDNHVASFLRRTRLTTDLTVFITPPGATLDSEGAASGGRTEPQTSQFRAPVRPELALHIMYNSLLFSGPRASGILAQMVQLIHSAASNPMAPVGSILIRTENEQQVLPDPRRDLDWCGYRGSITSIFEKNAGEFPDRRCLVESLLPAGADMSTELPPPASHVRTLTYAQLNEASNVVAHRLLQAGLQREEVVTVYAHRGIDMVIAVMATLKAGGTFSVIDPSYPPSRQNIYLQVARPRALIVLAKAGTIQPSVRQLINDELDLRVEIPALELVGDELRGGEIDGADVLDSTRKLASQSTGLVLGPDSVATLSFTSGSTGIPKGVQGRHYSLTHFFPWMGERFGLSAKDRFTMLSGIAHDPIQRDIFTPLFFGAELHIPTAEDIGTPGRLAEWMARSGATVTHLTPAMGQLLSAQASASIPELKNAFFVGDILTKRDCTRLQALAANVRIINMYGTTETQRAVSYFAIPPVSSEPAFLQAQKDIMPAGQGMIDVQLLVINRHARQETCAVGEMGEIYVRSGGLSEGYLALPDATAEKFLTNWLAPDLSIPDTLAGTPEGEFWKGPRDRMYRTGDLGRYLPDGTVECTGRADDQIKIRGFRIELGEIDTHLSRHPRVRENVTLVRRDKDEEKVLVSYFVPTADDGALSDDVDVGEAPISGEAHAVLRGIRRHRQLIRDIRDHLKRKLPTYSIPTLFVPLTKMPLNPNGKIDKPALPFPDTALAASAAQASGRAAAGEARKMTATQETIARLWETLLPAPPKPMPLDESFFDLGGHSILATRLVFALRQTFVVNIPLGLVFDAPTITELAKAVDALRSGDFEIASTGAAAPEETQAAETNYADDVEPLVAQLPASLPHAEKTEQNTVLLTGATGFLGAFVLHDLLSKRASQVKKVYVHTRARDHAAAVQRLRDALSSRGVWDENWVTEGRLDAVVGDLEKPRMGISEADWKSLADEVDVILHNGALVHWVYPYSRLRSANVLSTLAAIQLASTGRPKALTFVSSTSALDTPYYIDLSDRVLLSDSNAGGVSESDSLDGSARGLGSGYGQSKWVAERLLFAAAERGLAVSVVRPGYIVGASHTAVTNTDDFLWRLVKGSQQLGYVPDMENTINMVPVDHVARITALAALATAGLPPSENTHATVFHVTSHPKIRYSGFLGALARYGWPVERCDYVEWRQRLEHHVLAAASADGSDAETNALFPLLHFVLDDLPTSTKSPELDDRNTDALLVAAGERDGVARGVDEALVGLYLSWLVAVGFLPKPSGKGEPLPALPEDAVTRAVGRASAN
ncbi:L-2-aminoadipate reductase [Malassezia cuniculi]|uniref:Alpha-aminoadipate reductase n=1 Tax=Malassezia cuniculi TaxID=948313 RepID=A0AAF0ERT1_9BASI|nr:L-2-aminoadipate reductase [Malassezia cuniculi]